MCKINYRDYIIEALPYKPQNEKYRKTRIEIIAQSKSGCKERKEYCSEQKATSKEEAIQHCLNLGAQIIETEYETGPPPFADIA